MKTEQIISELKSMANARNVEGMSRFGINPAGLLGISVVNLRILAKEIGKNHETALELWDTGIHEARILAAFIDIPKSVTRKQMENWVKDFDSWDVCDQVCMNLFDKTPYAFDKAVEWVEREEEFVRRAGFALMAVFAVHNKEAEDDFFYSFFPLIIKYSTDERNFVKKAVNWALRQIGKRNWELNLRAIKCCETMLKTHPASKSARWNANDALRELTNDTARKRIESALKKVKN
ncbi:MAG: DNA alkylation repair protein [Bacteroidota bacterium]